MTRRPSRAPWRRSARLSRFGALTLLAAALLAGMPARAHADRREASVHAHLLGGLLSADDSATADAGTGPAGGIAVRASFATRNSFQYDASLSFLAGQASFDEGTFTPMDQPTFTGPFTIATQALRLDAGATLRLGVVWIPTIRLAAGLQARHLGAPTVEIGGVMTSDESRTGRTADYALDAVAVASLGLDHRINRRLIVGLAAGASYAVPLGGESFRTLELTAHAAYYWYPR